MNISSSSSLLTPPSVFRCFVCLSTVAYLRFLRIAKIMAATRIHTAGNVSIIIRNCLAEFSVFCSVFCSVSSSGIGGWFTEIGAAVLVASVGLTLWMELANAYRFQLTYREYSRQMEQKLQIQKQNYEELTEKMDEISRMRHDMRHHLRTIMSYTQQGKYQEMMEYLQEYASVITEGEKLICYCRNMAVDAVIHFYAGELRKKGIPFECDMMLPQNIGISDTDLCKIYGNLLENAVDAVKDLLPENKPYVKMLTKVKNRKLLIEISNPYSNEIQRREKVFYSTKHEGFGIGTASVAEVVQRMGGYVVFNTEEGIFKVNIFLPVKTVQ